MKRIALIVTILVLLFHIAAVSIFAAESSVVSENDSTVSAFEKSKESPKYKPDSKPDSRPHDIYKEPVKDRTDISKESGIFADYDSSQQKNTVIFIVTGSIVVVVCIISAVLIVIYQREKNQQ